MKDRTELLQQQELDQDDGNNEIYIKSYLDDYQPEGDYENTARESGYLNGLYDAIQLLKGNKGIDDFIL